MIRVSLLLAFAACGKAPPEKPEPSPATDQAEAAYQHVLHRLPAFLEQSQVVSRKADGSPEHTGDSATFTATAIGALKCEDAAPLMDALAERLLDAGGVAERYTPRPIARTVYSVDAESALIYAYASYAARCGLSDLHKAAWSARLASIAAAGGKLHPELADAAEARLQPEFDMAQDAVSHAVGVRGAPSRDRQQTLAVEIAGWLAGVKAQRAACFRANVAWYHARALDYLKDSLGFGWTDAQRSLICAAADGLHLETWDLWCGDAGPMRTFAAGFGYNRWQYRFQRCTDWEEPDVAEGVTTPGVDALTAYAELHGASY